MARTFIPQSTIIVMKSLTVTFLLLVLSTGLWGQFQNKSWTTVQQAKTENVQFQSVQLFDLQGQVESGMESTVSEGSLLTLKPQNLSQLVNNAPEGLRIDIPTNEGTMQIELVRNHLLSPDFAVTTSTSEGNPVPYKPGVYYHGIINGNANSWAAISFFDNSVMGVLGSSNTGEMVLGKLQNDAQERYILYATSDFQVPPTYDCNATGIPNKKQSEHGTSPESYNPDNVVRLYFECEYDMYLENGSVSATVNYMTGIYNAVKTLYDNESVNTVVSEIFVWDVADPYTTSSTSTALTAFRNNRLTYNGDLAHLISRGAPAGGGVAWVDQLCGNYGYAYSYVYSYYNELPNYSWTVNVVAHEMGHNLGSWHTHDCEWDVNGNGTADKAIDGCGDAAGYGGRGSCNTGPLPPAGGGTIMSYCHLLSGVGIDLMNGFGPLPGDLIRDRVYNATCLSPATSCPVTVSFVKTDVTCQGSSDGSATATGSNGIAPYAFAWSTGATTATVSGLSAGTYTVTVTDDNGNGCSETASITITQPNAISLSTSATPASAPGMSDGAIDLSVNGGTPAYAYAWSSGHTTQDLTNIPEGTYSVTVTDQNTCSKSTSVTVGSVGCAISVSIAKTNVTCNGNSDGSATASGSNGISPYVYAWSTGATTATTSGLTAGTYTVTVTDDNGNGCSESASITITQPNSISLSTSTTPASLPGISDGAIDLSVSGGSPGYSYAWSNGHTTQDLTNIPEGTYSVAVTDQNACSKSTSVTVTSGGCGSYVSVFPFQESFESGLGLWTQGSSDDFDWTRQSGSTPTNGSGPNSAQNGSYYLYTEANGNSGSAHLSSPCLDLSGLGGSSVIFAYHMNGNHMGTLSLQVSTNNGNSWTNIWSKSGNQGNSWSNASVSLNNYLTANTKVRFVGTLSNGPRGDMAIDGISLQTTTPPCNEPTLSLSSTDASCNGASDGSATVSASGGISPYTYSWSNGGTSATITGLSAGSYSVTVTDNTGCAATGSVSVSEPPVMQLAFSATPESAPGANDGTIDLTVFNGSAPYGYNWSNGGSTEDLAGLPSGTYTVTVTDANGCTESGSVAVNGAPGCNQTVNLPYSEGFESGMGLWSQSTSDDFDWTRNSGGTSTNSTGPSGAAEGSWYLFTDGNGQSGPYASLVSPCIDLTSAVSPELSFARSLNGNQMGTLDLDISTDNGTTWNNIWSLSGDQGSNWQTETISLNAYQGMVVSLRFTGTRGGKRSDMAIDDINVIDAGSGAMHPNEGIQTTQEEWEWMGLYPNPAKNQVKINMTTEVEKSLPLYLIDASGKRIGLGTAEVPAGQNVVTIDLNNQPAGIYLLVVGEWRDQKTKSLVIQP